MYEHMRQPLLTRAEFTMRMLLHIASAIGIIAVALGIGIAGYHGLEGLSWVDSLLNASMILGGMGPVNELHTAAGKVFASFYALLSGLLILVVAGVLFGPIVHRFLHRFHLAVEDEAPGDGP
jgi:hypothetical protein